MKQNAILIAALLTFVSGCVVPTEAVIDCGDAQVVQLYFQDNFTLGLEIPAAGKVAGNGFNAAFTTNDMDEWRNKVEDLPETYWLLNNVTIDFWVKNTDAVAPIAIGGDPGEGYHFFNQFGSDAGFIESYAIEYDEAVTDDIVHYTEVLDLDQGHLIEAGNRMRLLLTSLVLDGGHEILYGGSTPSSITVTVQCTEPIQWTELEFMEADVFIPFNQGLLTGAVPEQEGVNFQTVPFTLLPETNRLTIEILQTSTANEVKNDIDLSVMQGGNQIWSIGSPYTDEIGTKWAPNLENMPAGDYTIRVNSYSGNDYTGKLFVTQDA